jgi:hypothetical protein
MPDIEDRLHYLVERLRTAYESIGHSSGRPYIYFVYPPEQERVMRRLADEQLNSSGGLCFYHVDLLDVTIEALADQEARRQDLLNDPNRGAGAAESILRLWARAVTCVIADALAACLPPDAPGGGPTELPSVLGSRPVVVLRGLAALHPLGNPTTLMEAVAEQELRDPGSGRAIPVVLLVPGLRPPGSSRTYLFLGREDLGLQFYRGEEV